MFQLVPTILTLTLALTYPPPLHFQPIEDETKQHKGHAVVDIRSDVGWIGSAQQFNVVVQITPDSGWHVYWKNPGSSGAPTKFEVEAPAGFTVGEPVFPRPMTFQGNEGQTYGYDSAAAIFIPVTAPDHIQDGQLEITVTTSWLACKKSCVMGEQTNTLTIGANSLHQGPLHKDLQLVNWLKALPKPLEDLESGEAILSGDTLHITGEEAMRPIQFIGVEQQGVRFLPAETPFVQNGHFRLPVPMLLDISSLKGDDIVIEGLLLFGRNSDDPSYVVKLHVDK